MSDDPKPQATPEEIEAQRRRVFESLPAEVQRNPQVRKSFGLGDAVAAVAQPIARALGLPEDCEPCKRRRAKLNRIRLWGRG